MKRRRCHRRSGLGSVLPAVAGLLTGAAPALAAAELIMTFADAPAGKTAAVELAAPDGGSQEATDDDGDGVVLITIGGGAGTYRLTARLGDDVATRELDVPASGQVSVFFLPPSAGERWRVTYSGANEKIVVTARRREEDLQATPISITAFSAEGLEDRSMRDLSDLGDFTPNLDFTTTDVLGGSSSNATVYIRGIGQISTALFSDPGVGIYVDGVYLARAQGAVLGLLDLERVEILRGPQGTLFGKNTIGGAVSLITRKPGGDFAGYAELAAGNYRRLDGRAHVNVPLGERVYGSLSAASSNADGVTESLATGEDYYDDDKDTGRLALRFVPSDRVTVDWTADYSRQHERAVDTILLALDHSVPILEFYNKVTAAAGLPTYDERFITGDLHRSYSNEANFTRGHVGGTALSIDWNLGDLSLRSITSYREVELNVSNDFDGSPIRYAVRPAVNSQDQLTQELQLLGLTGKLDWVVGALYFTEQSSERAHGELLVGLFDALEAAPGPIYAPPGLPDLLCDPGPTPPGLPCFGGAGNPFNLAFFVDTGTRTVDDLSTDSYAVFGEGTYAASDKVSVTLGVRYTHDRKDYHLRELPGPQGITPPVDLFNDNDWDAVTPRLSLGWQARPRLFLYAMIANGFKSGGFNGLRGGSTATLLEPFDPEKVWSWEVGFKSDLAGNRLRLNGAVYLNDYTDLQLTASAIVGGQPATLIQNAGKSEIKGFELELQAQPTRGLLVNLGVGYTDTRYTDLDDTVLAVTLDGVIPKTPEWTVVFSPQHTWTLHDGGAFILRADYSYKSKLYNDVGNSELVAQAPYDLVHARASYIWPSGRWEVAAFGTNLLDEEYLESGVFPAGFGPAIGVAGRPREWGLSARYRFH